MILRTLIFFFELIRMGFWVYVVNILINKPRLRKEVQSVYEKANAPFDPSYFHRIYFHLILSAVIVLWFSTLRGKWLSKKEQKAAVCLGAATPLYDDLYDELDMDRDAVREIHMASSQFLECTFTIAFALCFLTKTVSIYAWII